jgi:hypothetical protein
MSETQKRTEFAKAYASAKPEDRIGAINLLKGAKEGLSMTFLSQVVTKDAEPEVRLAAFLVISDWEDPQGKLEPIVLELYRNEKNRPTKIDMAKAFPKLKTKTAATDESIKLLCLLFYPETYDGNNDGNGRDNQPVNNSTSTRRRSKEEIEAMRKEFTEVLGIVNTLTGQSFSGGGSKVQDQIRKWWVLHKSDFQKADAEMLVKLRDEFQAASAKQAADDATKK